MKENEPIQNERGANMKEKTRRVTAAPSSQQWSVEARRLPLCCSIVLATVAALPLWASCRNGTDDGRAEEAAPAPYGQGVERVPPAAAERHADHWTCPMHPNVQSHEPGDCPICGMKLVPAASSSSTASPHDHHAGSRETGKQSGTPPPHGIQMACPVSGEDINPEVFSDYRGVRVFFCCPSCRKKFTNEPDKYLASLPAEVQQRIRSAPQRPESHSRG